MLLGRRHVGGADLHGVRHGIPFEPGMERSHEIRKESIRRALREGRHDVFGSPIEISVDKQGNAEVVSGRHRVEVLREEEFRRVRLPAVFRRGVTGQ